MRLRSVLVVSCLTALPLLAVPPAQAATTSTGVRCTLVGTANNDVLNGSAGNDVICGLGGNDILRGGGGNDLIDGGLGNDLEQGGAGSDVLLGNVGNDHLQGGDANDRLDGGAGDDREEGDSGNDAVLGSSGNDTLNGGAGSDQVSGQDGNDDLDGGTGSDALGGGNGTNWCTLDGSDSSRQRCVYDNAVPVAVSVSTSTRSVDVTDAPRSFTYQLHLTDDTGLTYIQVIGAGQQLGYPSLVSGTVRDGYWRGTATLPRFLEPGQMVLQANMHDRVGHDSYREFADVLTIVDRTPDRALPVVTDFSLSATSVDTRTAGGALTTAVRVTDDASGAREVYACPSHQFADTWRMAQGCSTLTLAYGTTLNGVWKGSVPIPAHSFAGDWNMDIWTSDAVHLGSPSYWFGPDAYASATAGGVQEPSYHRLPFSRGRFTVLGTGDSTPPTLSTVTIRPASIDTLPSAQTVTFDIAARDDAGITDIGLYVNGPEGSDSQAQVFWGDLAAPTSGSPTNGVWHFDVVVPQGTPVGTYDVQLLIQDRSHARSWVSATMPGAGQNGEVAMTAGQTPGSDGTIKVVPHPA